MTIDGVAPSNDNGGGVFRGTPAGVITGIDTSGAGDVLHGAFCHHFAATSDFEASLRRAAQLATRSCQALGIIHCCEPRD